MSTYKITISIALSAFMITACRGPSGDQGATGAIGVQGQSGATGPQGVPGVNGTNGVNSQDATPVTWVQFCTGVPSYPSTFPEGGFCISGNIYAIYSANDGFMTLIPPGAYSSDGIGSSCNFTVLVNCQIQH